MKIYHLAVFCGGIQVSISAVKREKQFFQALSKAVNDRLVGVLFTMNVYDNGVVIESGNISEKFLGSTIPFVYGSRQLELRVYPETLS